MIYSMVPSPVTLNDRSTSTSTLIFIQHHKRKQYRQLQYNNIDVEWATTVEIEISVKV